MGCCVKSTTNSSQILEGNQKAEQAQISQKPFITVATLNYCGIMNSPFQFYCIEFQKELKELSQIFVGLIKLYIPNFNEKTFKWNFGKIDLKVRTERYSSMFHPHVGIIGDHFMTKAEFEKTWDEVFTVQAAKLKFQCSPQEKQVAKLYDLITYHSFLKYALKIETIEEAQQKRTSDYLKVMEPFYKLSFLNEERKLKKIIDNFSKMEADIFFFQQFSQFFKQYLQKTGKYYISCDKQNDTLIIALKNSFKVQKNVENVFAKLSPQQFKNLNWADRSAFMVVDNYILICAHLSSKADKNSPQIQQLKVGLQDLKKTLPQYQIILGGDLNSFLKTQESFSKIFNTFPSDSTYLTTIKKRTMTQGQFNKGDKLIQESKDKLISTLDIIYPKITYITGVEPKNDAYVPTDEHPFDHFVLTAKLKKK